MKKQVLSALAFCSALGIAQAQTDVTKEYLVNPSFETLKAADGTTDVTVKTTLENGLQGWEVVAMSHYQVESEASGSSTGFPADGSGKIKPTEGTYYYFNRQGWGNKDSELKTTTSKELPAGTYYAVIDYKAADYSNNNNANTNGTTIGIKVNDAASNLLGENPAVRRAYSMANGGSNPESDAYMVNAAWNELGTMFTVTEPTTVTISLVQNMRNNGRSDIAWDNLRLYQIENVSENKPMDVSGLITTSNYYALGGWNIEGGNTFQVNTWSTEGEKDGSGMTTPFIQDHVGKENKAANATISHTVNHLIPGIYEVSGLIRVLNEAGGDTPSGATLYANEGSTNACNGNPCTNGVYGTYTVKGTVGTDGVLTFGIKVANGIYESSEKVDEIEAATKALEEAIQALKHPTLNAPKEGELFCIANISEGFGYKNNAVSPVYNEAKAEDGEYDLKWYHIVNANYAQALKFTPVEGQKNQYTISFIDEEGNTRYFSTQALAGYMDGGNVSTRHDRIRATKEAEKALPFEISLAGEGVYKLKIPSMAATSEVQAMTASSPRTIFPTCLS